MNQATVRNNPDPRQQVLSAVQAADSVLLFCHVSPDGDTLGSALALKLRLTAMGKSVRLLVDGEVPSNLAFLSSMGAVEGPEAAADAADLALAVDVSCKERLGACAPGFSCRCAHRGGGPSQLQSRFCPDQLGGWQRSGDCRAGVPAAGGHGWRPFPRGSGLPLYRPVHRYGQFHLREHQRRELSHDGCAHGGGAASGGVCQGGCSGSRNCPS